MYMAVRYTGGNTTRTTGSPNPTTGRMSIACEVEAFTSKEARDNFVNRGYLRQAVNKKTLRELKMGMSIAEYKKFYNSIQEDCYEI